MKRLLAIIVALALLGLGPVPLSLCAQLSLKAAECVTPATESQCNRMDMANSDVTIGAAPNSSCCDLSRAPISDRQQNTSEVGLTAIVHIVPIATEIALPIQQVNYSHIGQDVSPPLQSFLCIFLI
jgi:hypothetical protein